MAKAKKAKKVKKVEVETVEEDPRLQYYKPKEGRADVLLLDALSKGHVFDTLTAAVRQMKKDSVLYISDTRKSPKPPGPGVRAVLKQNLLRWFDRTGLVPVGVREEKDRIYAIARKA